MTNPVIYPDPLPGQNNVQCATGSQRTPDEANAQPCHACGHWSCHIGPRGPVPCDLCVNYVYQRGVVDTFTGSSDTVVGHLTQRVTDLETAVARLTARINAASIP